MLRWFSKPLSVRQMRLLCASLLAGFALCGALQGLCWGRTQLDAGAALCADTLRLHIRQPAMLWLTRAPSSGCGTRCFP